MGTKCAPFVAELYFIIRDFMLSESDIIFKLMVFKRSTPRAMQRWVRLESECQP